MTRLSLLLAAAVLPSAFLPTAALGQTATAPAQRAPVAQQAAALRDEALRSDTLAWDITEGLSTEVGPRLAGTEAEARARQWMAAKLRALGFRNVRIEEFDMPVWVRGEERAEIVAPFPQPLTLAALGRSAATPARGLTSEVVAFDSLAAFEAAPDAAVRGQIVYITHRMSRTQDGSSYGQFGAARFQGPALAARKGAAAILIRSIGTDSHRTPHTGVTTWPEGVRPIPAAALANPDADQLERVLARGRPVKLRLTLTPRMVGTRRSGNVIAEVPGSDPRAGTILVGGHLDSWDLSPGIFDNAAGIGIITAAAKRIMTAGQPRRTIRVVAFGAEEVGVLGGTDYYNRHRGEGDVVLVAESDFGADRVWRLETSLAPENQRLGERLAALLSPLGVVRGRDPAGAGADLGAWARSGTAAIDLNQDGTRYFDLHHTANDTLDKVDPAQLRQNVAAWVAMLALMADAAEPVGRVPPRN